MNNITKFMYCIILAVFSIISVIAQPPNKPIRTEPGSSNSTGGNAGTTGGNGAWGPDTATSRPSTVTNPSAGDVMADTSGSTVEGSGNFNDNNSGTNEKKEKSTGWAWLGIIGLGGLAGLTALNRNKR